MRFKMEMDNERTIKRKRPLIFINIMSAVDVHDGVEFIKAAPKLTETEGVGMFTWGQVQAMLREVRDGGHDVDEYISQVGEMMK